VRRAGDYVVYLGLRGLWALLRLVPLAALRRLLESLAFTVMLVDRRHRRVIDSNLAIAFPEWSRQRRRAATRRAFGNWGRIAAELVHDRELAELAEAADPAKFAEGSWLEAGEKILEELRSEGTGVLVLTAHTGNFELLARIWGACRGAPITVFHRPLKNPYVDGLLVRQRAAMGVRTLGRGMGLREALRTLGSGGILAAPLDQNQPPGRPGVFVELFGRPAATTTVLARLSLAAAVPVVPVFACWEGARPAAVIGPPIHPPRHISGVVSIPRGENRERAVRELTQAYTAEVEAMVRRYPEQWNWAHRRWKTQPNKE
jgi:KDO2-lipid IV(A) lauroyltransferase